jgi:protein SCO1
MARFFPTIFAIAAFAVLLAVPTPADASGPDGLVPAAPTAPANENVVIAEQIGAQVPLDTVFRNEEDKPISLRDCTAGKPTILVPMYYRCPKLCNIVLENLIEALREIPNYSVGKEFNVVCVSFDPKEHADLAAEKRKNTLAAYGRPNAENSWRFLTGTKESIQTLTSSVGFRYEFDRTFKEYNHPSGLIILTPDGKVARYFYGVGFKGTFSLAEQGEGDFKIPGGTTTLRLSLVEASEGKMGSLKDRLLLTCYSWDHSTGYAFQIMRAVQIGGILTLLAMGTWLGLTIRRERRRTAENKAAPHSQHDGAPSGEIA